MNIDSSTQVFLGNTEIVEIRKGNVSIWQKGSTPPPPAPDYFYIENTYAGSNTLTLTTVIEGSPSSSDYSNTVQYSKDKTNWTTVTFNSISPRNISMDQGDKVYFRNDNGRFNFTSDTSNTTCYYTSFSATYSHSVGGNVMSLIDYTNMSNTTLVIQGCLNNLFYLDSELTDASDLGLPATTLSNLCYFNMFRDCTSLTASPVSLPATTLGEYCYYTMFFNCHSLVSIPSTLPATTLAPHCYHNMFNKCYSNTTVPTLPATTLSDSCYFNMFLDNTSLTTVPSNLLPVTNLSDSCYRSMFMGCSSLTNVPSLPATTLAQHCYDFMFSGCSSLTTVSQNLLPATTLYPYCYRRMFQDCTSLTNSPALPATTLTNNCYQEMFSGCSSLNNLTVYANNISASNCTNNWVVGVAQTGTFYNNGTATWPKNSTSGIPTGWTEYKTDYFYIENEYAGTNTVTLSTTKKGTPTAGTYTTSIQYSKDKSNWTTYTNLTRGYVLSINLNQGEKVYFRNDNGVFNNYTSGSVYNYTAFTATYSHSVGGNINSLLDYRNIDTVTFSSGCFYRLFYEDYSLVDSHSLILPATTLSERCYSNLFIRCTSMTTTVSELPGTTLAENCYDGMYYSCSSLTTAPDLKATTLVTSCYSGMFANCTLLSSIKVYANDNSATSCTNNWLLNVAGSGTFNNLGSATYTVDSASGIPTGWTEYKPDYLYLENTYAGTNTVSIYTRSSGNPSSSLYSDTVEYSKDKSNWTTLTFTPGNTLTISLNQGEKIYFRNNNGKFNYYDDRNGTGYWLNQITTDHSCVAGGNPNSLLDYTNIDNVSLTTGCFACLFLRNNNLTDISYITLPSTTLAPYCYLNIFRETSVTTPVSLPATTLEYGCYQSMYEGCSSLTTAPVLHSMTLTPHCYQSMFNGCSSLTTAPVLPATTLESYCYSGMFKNCSSITTAPTLPATTLLQRSYYQMFYGCSSLNEVKTYANNVSATECTLDWLSGVANSGTFYNLGSATYTSGASGIPSGWTVVTQ